MTLYKWTDLDGSSCNGGSGKWPLPTQLPDGSWEPGRWQRRITAIEPCERGYHLCREQDLLWWIGPALWEAEADGDTIEHGSITTGDSKIVVARARLVRPVTTWNERTARLFAADCAEQVLHLWEADYPDDARPRGAIEVGRRFARGEATNSELYDAWAAAWVAGGAAAGDAARVDAWADAWAAAWVAAGVAAGAAAGAAARVAARDAARAAWVAARVAARDAARAAWVAAGDAAWVAARAAARAAAGDAARVAARAWQRQRLMEYITGGRS